MALTFKLEVVTPQQEIYSGDVVSLQMPAYLGSMGVLAHHAPMLTELIPGALNITPEDGQKQLYSLSGGFVEVGGNRAVLLADAVERPEEIDVKRAQSSKDRAEKRIQEKHEKIDLDRAYRSLERALVRVRVAQTL